MEFPEFPWKMCWNSRPQPVLFGDLGIFQFILRYNLPEGRCKIRVHREPVEHAEDLKELLATGDQPWHLATMND